MRDKFACNYSQWSLTDVRTNYRLQSPLQVYVPDPRDRGNCVRIPRRRRVGCFLLPVVSVIKSSLLTNESRVECNHEFIREMERRGQMNRNNQYTSVFLTVHPFQKKYPSAYLINVYP